MDKRYLIVAGAFMVQAVIIGCVFAYGVYFTELESEFGWSRTQLSAATSLGFFSMGLMAAIAGQMNDRYGPRRVVAVAALSTSVAYVLLSTLNNPWQLFFIYGTLIGVGLAVHDVVTLSTIARWFPHRRGLMSGIVKVGTACGQMLVPLIVVALISTVGWRQSFVVLGVSAGIILLSAAWLMGAVPAITGVSRSQSETDGVQFRIALQNKSLWLLCGVQFFSFATLTTIPTHIVPHAIDLEFSKKAAATLLTVIAFSSIFGRLLVGMTYDRFGGGRTYIVSLVILSVSLITLLLIEQHAFLYFFAVIYGFSHGGLFTVVSPTVAEFFGMREHGKIFGLIVFFGTIGGSLMPVVTGRIFDLQGSYTAAFYMLTSMAVISLGLAVMLPRQVNAS